MKQQHYSGETISGNNNIHTVKRSEARSGVGSGGILSQVGAANKDSDGERTQREGESLQAQIPPDLHTFIHCNPFSQEEPKKHGLFIKQLHSLNFDYSVEYDTCHQLYYI